MTVRVSSFPTAGWDVRPQPEQQFLADAFVGYDGVAFLDGCPKYGFKLEELENLRAVLCGFNSPLRRLKP